MSIINREILDHLVHPDDVVGVEYMTRCLTAYCDELPNCFDCMFITPNDRSNTVECDFKLAQDSADSDKLLKDCYTKLYQHQEYEKGLNNPFLEEPQEEPEPTEDLVNHPSHYTHGGMECIDEMLMIFGREAVMHFCLCNAWKYRKRCLYKNGDEDMKKSDWYINKYKELKLYGTEPEQSEPTTEASI